MGVVQLGVVQLGVVQMGVDPWYMSHRHDDDDGYDDLDDDRHNDND